MAKLVWLLTLAMAQQVPSDCLNRPTDFYTKTDYPLITMDLQKEDLDGEVLLNYCLDPDTS